MQEHFPSKACLLDLPPHQVLAHKDNGPISKKEVGTQYRQCFNMIYFLFDVLLVFYTQSTVWKRFSLAWLLKKKPLK